MTHNIHQPLQEQGGAPPAPAGAEPAPASQTWGIADLAREFGITTRTIRFYEDRGLLSPGRKGGAGRTRIYTHRDRARLRLALRGKRLGLALDDIRALLDMFETPADTPAQLARLLDLLDERETVLRERLTDITQTLAEIATQRKQARRLLEGHRLGQHSRKRRAAPGFLDPLGGPDAPAEGLGAPSTVTRRPARGHHP